MIINGIELKINMFNTIELAKYSRANAKVVRASLREKTNVPKAVKLHCNSVYSFVTILFGRKTAKALIPNKNDFENCVNVFTAITEECVKQIEQVKAYNPSLTSK